MKGKTTRIIAAVMAMMMLFALTACGSTETQTSAAEDTASSGEVYKVGIVQYVDDASLNQITSNIQKELDAKGEELGVTFEYADYTKNGQADGSALTQIGTELVADEVDVIVAIATPTAQTMVSVTEDTDIPVIFSAVSDPVSAGLVESWESTGGNITGTSDKLDTESILKLMMAADEDLGKVGLLYSKNENSSEVPIEEAKAFLDEQGISYVEKTGTTTDEIQSAADALVAEGVDAVFTPTDNAVMTAELSIYQKFIDAGIPQYCGADSFALNGAFLGYGVDYAALGVATADMVVDCLVNGAVPSETPVQTFDNGIATVNTETSDAIGFDTEAIIETFKPMCNDVLETVTAQEFDD